MTGDGRVAWLAAIAARDPALGADLEGLLAEHEDLQESRFLERAAAPGQRPAEVPSLAGQIVGAYRLHLADRPGRDGQRLAGRAL